MKKIIIAVLVLLSQNSFSKPIQIKDDSGKNTSTIKKVGDKYAQKDTTGKTVNTIQKQGDTIVVKDSKGKTVQKIKK